MNVPSVHFKYTTYRRPSEGDMSNISRYIGHKQLSLKWFTDLAMLPEVINSRKGLIV